MKYTRAIIRRPSRSMVRGLTTAGLGIPDYDLALQQHDAYAQALRQCGLNVITLPAQEDFPDSTFVEDTALLTPECAIIMRPGAETRRGETTTIEEACQEFFQKIFRVEEPGTADAGDIMAVGRHYYIGLSQRTNVHGARQIITILESHQMTGSVIPVGQGLHLKSGMSYLEHDNVLVAGQFRLHPALAHLHQHSIEDDEQYAANSVWLNGTVLIPSGYPKTEAVVRSLGYRTLTLDVSEFRRLDGGLSCLSLRF